MYNERLDFGSHEEISKHQITALKKHLEYISNNSPFYKKLIKKNGISINKINSISDLKYLPTTSKDELQQFNWDFLAVPKENIREFSTTSGTLGSPVTIALTQNDLNRLAYNEYLSFLETGASSSDIFQLALTLDKQFIAGMAYYLGASKLSAGVVRTGPGAPSMQWETINRINSTSLVVVPSFLIKLIEFAHENSIDLNKSSVKRAICIGENIRNQALELNTIGQKVKEHWNINLHSTYASTEMQTAFTECSQGQGGHIHSELLIAEVLNDDGLPVNSGECGELTITTLGIEGMPLLRYRTGDLCSVIEKPCLCGRNSLRITPIYGRKQQMIKFKGTTLYPPAIFDILNSQHDIKDYLIEVFSNEFGNDEILIHIAAREQSEKLTASLKSYLHASLRVRPEINFSTIEDIQLKQSIGVGRKISKFIDNRVKASN